MSTRKQCAKAVDHWLYPAVQSRLLEQTKGSGSKLCVAVRLEQKQTAMHFQSAKHRQFLKIVLATPTLVTKARGQTNCIPVRPCGSVDACSQSMQQVNANMLSMSRPYSRTPLVLLCSTDNHNGV